MQRSDQSKFLDSVVMQGFDKKAAANQADAEKQLLQLKNDPALAQQVLEELNKAKAGQKIAVTAAMSPVVKSILMGLMLLAPSAFASEGGLDSLKMMLKNPSSISMEKVEQIQDRSEKTQLQQQQDDLKQLAKTTAPGAALTAPRKVNIKGVEITPVSEGQMTLVQKAIKMINDLGSSGSADAETLKTQAEGFVKIIQQAH